MQPEKGHKGKSFKQRLVLKSSLAKETLSEFLGTFVMIVSISWFPEFWPNNASLLLLVEETFGLFVFFFLHELRH